MYSTRAPSGAAGPEIVFDPAGRAESSCSCSNNLIRRKVMQKSLRKSSIVSGLALGAAFIVPTAIAASENTLHWQSVIGIVQANNVVGSGTGAATGGGAPWSAQGGHVDANFESGEIHFAVRGLVLAGGNSIGTPGAVVQVKGTLVCDTDGSASGGNSVLVDTPLVDLDDQGNASFDGPVGQLPSACATEPDIAFLIRVGAGRWIANGTVVR
jgi:hypothetical protein